MKVINVVRRFLAVVIFFVLLPIAWICVVLTVHVGLFLACIEEMGVDTGIVGETFLKVVKKWQELYKGIIFKVVP